MGRREMSGTLYGIGVGPGDPELVTLKAQRLARACPVLAYPAPDTGDSLARAIMAPHLPAKQIEIAIRVPMSVERYPALPVYDDAARDIATHLDAGRDVAALCLGDPFLYGSFMYLFQRLAERHKIVIVPGVTSLSAASASLRFPLTARNDSLAIIPATLPDDELTLRIQAADCVALVKLGRHFARARALLETLGLTPDAHYVERASMRGERIIPLADVDPAAVPYFSMILVHRRGKAWQ
jgi:precorrin-2/cobalt-factor-2 C20-methyltransferase